MRKGNAKEYGKVAQRLHWLVAALVLLMSALGFLMSGQPAGSEKSPLVIVHILFGCVLTVSVLFRVIWKWFDVAPDPPSKLSPLNLLGFKSTHVLIYVALFTMALSGLTMALSFQIPFLPLSISGGVRIGLPQLFLFHKLMVVILWGLIAGHVGGVLYYQLAKGDVLSRMGIKRFNKP